MPFIPFVLILDAISDQLFVSELTEIWTFTSAIAPVPHALKPIPGVRFGIVCRILIAFLADIIRNSGRETCFENSS